MKKTEEIFAEYQQANEEQRLELYLAYRELRAIFDEIDSVQSDSVNAPIRLGSYKMIRNWIIMLFRKRLTFMTEGR